MSRLLCWFLGHKNTISCVADGRLTHDKCGRCGANLPVAYPYHELYRILRGKQ